MKQTAINPVALENKATAWLAAVVSEDSNQADSAMDAVIGSLRTRGYQLVGLRQRLLGSCDNGCGVRLQSIATGAYHKMTQDLGSGSTSCNIDSDALERLAQMTKDELHDGVDLVVVNRFGKRESQGGGFCSVFERAIDLGIPVLTVVNTAYLQSWLEYGGDYVTSLRADNHEILNWAESVTKKMPIVGVNSA